MVFVTLIVLWIKSLQLIRAEGLTNSASNYKNFTNRHIN
jgi:hypothetical protein